MTTLTIYAAGNPKPKGSMKHVGKGRMVEQVADSPKWRKVFAAATREAVTEQAWECTDSPVVVSLEIVVPRPKSVNREHPSSRSAGDIDKHQRNIFDALVDGGAIVDDSQIIGIGSTVQRYPAHDEQPHVWLRLAIIKDCTVYQGIDALSNGKAGANA